MKTEELHESQVIRPIPAEASRALRRARLS
jgi:hypothetical protein